MLLQVMQNDRHDLVVTMAGYKDKMDRFFNDVPDLSSRVGHHIDFPTTGRMRHAIRIYDTVEEKQKLTKADLVTPRERGHHQLGGDER